MEEETDIILASSPVDAGISCWKLSTGEELLRHRGCASPSHGLICVNQRFIASSQFRDNSSGSGSILYWSWNKPVAEVRSFPAEPIMPLVTNTDGTYIIGGGSLGNIYLWEVVTGKLLRKWHAHYRDVTSLVWLEGESLLVSGSKDGNVRVWSLFLIFDDERREEAEHLYEYSLSEHSLPVTDLVCSVVPRNAIIISASEDCTCKVWNISGKLLRSILFPTVINAIELHPVEDVFYAGGRDGKIYIGALTAESSDSDHYGKHIIGALPDHGKAICSLAFDSKGVLLISGSEDGIIRVWDIITCNIVRILKHSKGPVNNIFVVKQLDSNPIPLLTRQVPSKRHILPLPPPLEKYENEDSVSKTVVSMPTNPSGTYYSHLMIKKLADELQELKLPLQLTPHGLNGAATPAAQISMTPEELKHLYDGVFCLHRWQWITQQQQQVHPHSSNWHPLRHAAIAAVEYSNARDRQLYPGPALCTDGFIEMQSLLEYSPPNRQKTTKGYRDDAKNENDRDRISKLKYLYQKKALLMYKKSEGKNGQ